ncbi:MAG: threonylcarbamoyl-AMP synthase [Nitrosomonadaceae bacterium]|nr:threonylcarbamoyl-AMP synthase [Nitrosomonadaceae bacterium]|tara:strand:- start:210 stop:1205 length:996 start_codon:yes stop_codon:yes gene_type:complete
MQESSSLISSAAKKLKEGKIVAFPTETVYGLGADISIPSAVDRIFEIKERPINHPLIIHFSKISQLNYWAQEIPKAAYLLAKKFWPGPLTLILPRTNHVSLNVTGGQNMVGLRIPDHPTALTLLDAMGPNKALAAPSANRFGRISPTTAAHVFDELGHKVDMILDGGSCKIGLESTIVGFKNNSVIVLRPGGVSLTKLAEVLDEEVIFLEKKQSDIRVSGSLDSHYAPLTPLEVWPIKSLWDRCCEIEKLGLSPILLGWSPEFITKKTNKKYICFPMPNTPTDYGRQLYATLRQFDNGQYDYLLLEAPPDTPDWIAVSDRLQRASFTVSTS